MTTKVAGAQGARLLFGAGAEGARPFSGAVAGRPHVFASTIFEDLAREDQCSGEFRNDLYTVIRFPEYQREIGFRVRYESNRM